MLRKHLEENQRLKRSIKKFEEQGFVSSPPGQRSRAQQEQMKHQIKRERKDVNDLINEDMINKKFMDGLANQLESFFVTQETDNSEGGKLTSRSG